MRVDHIHCQQIALLTAYVGRPCKPSDETKPGRDVLCCDHGQWFHRAAATGNAKGQHYLGETAGRPRLLVTEVGEEATSVAFYTPFFICLFSKTYPYICGSDRGRSGILCTCHAEQCQYTVLLGFFVCGARVLEPFCGVMYAVACKKAEHAACSVV